MVHVQEMDEADIEAVSTIRVRGWQAAYAGIVPQTYLDAMTAEGDAGQRRQRFSQPGRTSSGWRRPRRLVPSAGAQVERVHGAVEFFGGGHGGSSGVMAGSRCFRPLEARWLSLSVYAD
ncbi:hypothetical protein AB0D40_32085 [Streptomyces massasporeus]|uniref:hypothetical protein n=1 Tax=Streptomyces massasporeus TaxID=67324 RepID=UPI0033D0A772